MAFLPSSATSFLVCPYLFGDVCQCFFLCTHPAHSSLSISIASSTSVCSVLVAIQLFCLCHCPSVACCLAAAQLLPVVWPTAAPKLFCRLCDCPVHLVVAACSAACPDVAQASILSFFGSPRFSARPACPGFVVVPRLSGGRYHLGRCSATLVAPTAPSLCSAFFVVFQPVPTDSSFVHPLSGFWFILDVVLAVWFLHYRCCSARPVVWPSIYLCPVDLFSVLSVRSVSGVSRHVFSALFVFQVVVGVFVTVAILVVYPPAAVCHPAHSGWFVWFGRISILINLFFVCATVVSSY